MTPPQAKRSVSNNTFDKTAKPTRRILKTVLQILLNPPEGSNQKKPGEHVRAAVTHAGSIRGVRVRVVGWWVYPGEGWWVPGNGYGHGVPGMGYGYWATVTPYLALLPLYLANYHCIWPNDR